jgi:lysyl-tRNA synthetase class 2
VSSQPSDWREQRRRKLADLSELGLEYHPTVFAPTHRSTDILGAYESLKEATVTVAGRIVAINHMGKAAFVRLQDATGRIQMYLKRDSLSEAQWSYYRLLDLGDLIGATGTVFMTRTGEVTVEVSQLVLLQKSYHPLPEKFHGLADVEARYRQRYVDLIANEDSRRMARLRSAMTSAIRQFLDARGFIEVETPILQPIYGGGAAEPFTTRVAAFDADMYLRIADELYLKRLIVGGLERVYEIGKDFRNEGFSRKHSQEFTQLELYQAYADYNDMMRVLEEMVAYAAGEMGIGAVVEFDGHEIDLSPPWTRMTMRAAFLAHVDLDLGSVTDRGSLLEFANARGVVVDSVMSRGALLDQLWSTLVEPKLIQPTFITDYPLDFPGSTFARGSKTRDDEVERFEAFMGGIELANAFTEMNDPFEQESRLDLLATLTGESTDQEERDEDFIRALEYGMPPTGGMGLGIDRLAMILTGADHIRETILFPLLKRRDAIDA